MMTENDIHRVMRLSSQHIESFIEDDDYDLDDFEEKELLDLLTIESLEDESSDDLDEHGAPFM